MNLSTEDAQLFFKLFFALLAYANRQLQMVPNVATPEDIPTAGIQTAGKIRDALYEHPELFGYEDLRQFRTCCSYSS